MTLTITLPLPPIELHPNKLPHRMAKRRLTKAYKATATIQCLKALRDCGFGFRPKWDFVTGQATFTQRTAAHRDGDNLNAWIKAAQDSLAEAGIVKNDRGVLLLPPVQLIGPDEGVTLRIMPGKVDPAKLWELCEEMIDG